MNKVFLVYPVSRLSDEIEHLGLAYITSVLRSKGVNVNLFTYYIEKNEQELLTAIRDFEPDVIGFTTFSESLKNVINICEELKKMDSSVKIILGGHAVSTATEYLLSNNDSIDFIAIGDGEFMLCELIDFMNGKIKITDIAGLVHRDEDGKIIFNKIREYISNLDDLPFPARDFYIQAKVKAPIVLISTSRGCLGKCSFCSYSSEMHNKQIRWRGRSPENVVAEIQKVVEELNIHTFFFTDVTFEDPGKAGKKRIKRIAECILSNNVDIHYEVHFRAENWNEKEMGLLNLLLLSGMESVVVGIESGSESALKVYNKIARPEDNIRIVKLLKEAHISLEYGFIMFNAYTTFKECYENIKFFRDTGLGFNLKCILTRLEIYPGVLLEQKLRQDGLLHEQQPGNNNVFQYDFVDKRMEILSKNLCELPNQISLIEEFEFIYTRTRVILTRIWRKLYLKGILQKDIQGYFEKLENLESEMMNNNMRFLEACLRLAECGWSDVSFKNLCQEYIVCYLPGKISELKRLHNNIIKDLYKSKTILKQLHF